MRCIVLRSWLVVELIKIVRSFGKRSSVSVEVSRVVLLEGAVVCRLVFYVAFTVRGRSGRCWVVEELSLGCQKICEQTGSKLAAVVAIWERNTKQQWGLGWIDCSYCLLLLHISHPITFLSLVLLCHFTQQKQNDHPSQHLSLRQNQQNTSPCSSLAPLFFMLLRQVLQASVISRYWLYQLY